MSNTPDAGDVQSAIAAGMTRRAALKRAGLVIGATAWATPVVQTVFAGTAAATNHPPPACTPSDTSGCGGTCAKCGFGKVCTANSDCLSNECANGTCAKSNAGELCGANADCHTNSCNGTTCNKAVATGPCQVNGDCTTNVCTGGTCQKAAVGGTCSATTDCNAATSPSGTVTCTSGICGGNGSPCGNNNQCASGKCTGSGSNKTCTA